MQRKISISLLLLAAVFCLLSYQKIEAQNKAVENNGQKDWRKFIDSEISGDGKFAWCNYSSALGIELCLYNLLNHKKKIFYEGHDAQFTNDSRFFIFLKGDTLKIVSLRKKDNRFFNNVKSFNKSVKNNWIGVLSRDSAFLENLSTGRKISFPKVDNLLFNNKGTVCVVKDDNKILWVDLVSEGVTRVVDRGNIESFFFDPVGENLFLIYKKNDEKSIKIYKGADNRIADFLTDNSEGIPNGFKIADVNGQFANNGKYLIFTLQHREATSSVQDTLVLTKKVTIWNFKDTYLQPEQSSSYKTKFNALIPTDGNVVIALESDSGRLQTQMNPNSSGDFALLRNEANYNETYWNKGQSFGYSIINLNDGKITKLPIDSNVLASLSPDAKFVYWYNPLTHHLHNLEIKTLIARDLTALLPANILPRLKIDPGISSTFQVKLFWLEQDSTLLMCDDYDIWKISPTNKYSPINLTGGFGRKWNTSFRPVMDRKLKKIIRLNNDKMILLARMDWETKNNGFCLVPGNGGAPKVLLSSWPGLYYFPGVGAGEYRLPLKAEQSDRYLLQYGSDSHPIIPIISSDFKHFRAIDSSRPQREYNWLTTDLIHFALPGGDSGVALLYKPQNFDPHKKYPVIFYYYDGLTKNRFSFPWPELSTIVNISWYTSHEYLVCVPDLYYILNQTGANSVKIVEAAAHCLGRLAFADTSRMGLQGHSFGGYTTYFIATHSNMFKAAIPASGLSNFIELYGSTAFGGISQSSMCEVGQPLMGIDNVPWDSINNYIRNSPLLYVQNINTPVLIMHNKNDGAAKFFQSMEMYTALRRLKKPVWMLQYDTQDHIFFDVNCALDYNIRQQQFFEHYLKNKPMPRWMAHGIPAALKGKASRL